MSDFSNREKDFENKFVHDKNLDFKTESRAAKLFGLWIAEKLGFSGDKASVYAKGLVSANMEEATLDDILRKVKADLKAKNVDISDHILKAQLDKALTEARQQVMKEGG